MTAGPQPTLPEEFRSLIRFYRWTAVYVCLALTVIVVLLLRG